MTSIGRGWALAALMIGLVLGPTAPTYATGPSCDSAVLSGCALGQDGMNLSAEALTKIASGNNLGTGKPDKRVFEYTSVTACQLNLPGRAGADVPCLGAVQACAGNTAQQGLGPQIRLYRRELDINGIPTAAGWVLIGTTCFPELVPGKPVLGMALILAAFHNTPWAKPAVHIQPEGNITLVTLDTYFAVTWPTQGFQPGEIDTITLLGNPVQIRPTLKSYTYHFGDTTSTGPTTSPGGPYPDGDITHAYPKAGTYNTRIDITYGGEFSIDARTWVPIPDTVTIPGPTQTLTVKTAHARLVSK